MESTDLDMGEIFDDDGNEDDDIGAIGALPDLEDTQPQDNEDEENAEVLARLKDLSKGAAKKVIRKPQPKLDPTRLTGERGIPVLPKLFENTKFKGKGHEAQDLAVIMRQMEHWAHRLFPKMPFDEVIERVEKLGAKKEVQTCIKKIRLDMPILDTDFVGSEPEDDVVRNDGETDEPPTSNAEDVWDALLRDEAEVSASQVQDQQHTPKQKSTNDPAQDSPLHDNTRTESDSNSQSNSMSGGMTPAQIERMEKNKQLALERRLKKLGKNTPGKTPVASQQSPTVAQSQESSQRSSDIQATNLNLEKTDKVEINESQAMESDLTNELENSSKPNDINDDNADDEMSEVLEKGPSQINLVDKFAKNAQNWNTEGHGTNTDDVTEFVDNTEDTEAMDVETSDKILNKPESAVYSLNSETNGEMSEVIVNQDVSKPQTIEDKMDSECDTANVNNDSEEMSVVIPNQNEVGLEKKKSTNDGIDTQEMSEVIKNLDNS